MSNEKQIITAATALQNRQLLSALENLAVWDEGSPCFCHVHGGGAERARYTQHDRYCDEARAAIAKPKPIE